MKDVSKDIKFPTTEIYSVSDIKKVQCVLLEMTKVIVKILEEHNIPYFMAFGTLIGAIKFKGFLPWDDDIDLFLFDDSYDKAMELLEEYLPNNLIVHGEKNDPRYFLGWNSVKNINTAIEIADIYHPHNKLLNYKCLGVDLYRLKKINRGELDSYKHNEARKFFERKLSKKIISNNEYNEEINKLKLKRNKELDSSNYFYDEFFFFVVKVSKPIALDAVLPLKKIDFEDVQFYAPNDPLAVLSCSFSGLDKLPAYEQRKPHIKSFKFLVD